MARSRAKRADKPNPRVERNYSKGRQMDNIIKFNDSPKTKKRVEIIPRNVQQEQYLVTLEDPTKDIVIAVGPAGCGKSLIATMFAIRELRMGNIEKVVISRPNIAVDDKDIGFLPGDIFSKMSPWMMPILDVFFEYYSKMEVQNMLEEGVIEMVPLAFIRGRTFKNSFIILDEAQNTTKTSIMSALTRVGDNSRMVVTGDLEQSDRGKVNGLSDFLSRINNSITRRINVINFTQKDVERHPVVKEVLDLYNQ